MNDRLLRQHLKCPGLKGPESSVASQNLGVVSCELIRFKSLDLRSASTEATSTEATAPKEEAQQHAWTPNSVGVESTEFAAGLGTIFGAKDVESLVLELHHRRGRSVAG